VVVSAQQLVEGEVELGDYCVQRPDRGFGEAALELRDETGRQTEAARQLTLADTGLRALGPKPLTDSVELLSHINTLPSVEDRETDNRYMSSQPLST
jgi:hypothetical protein